MTGLSPNSRSQARTLFVALVVGVATIAPASASAQWSTTFEQFYFPDRSNWAFRRNYPGAERLFNAFDYGHAILYEKLYTKPGADPSILEVKEYEFITRDLLVHPPRVALEEAAIEVAYAKIAPEAKAMFDWAHVLHRQIYDLWADEGIPLAEKDARVAKLLTYYKSRRDLAFSSVPKNMELMEGQYYSRAFREGYPKFNGLIWAYHWLQVGLYEPLVTGKNAEERQTGVGAAVARFRQMLEDAPERMPRMMPMTAAIAPEFTRRYPEAAVIFDNLHAMHDVISDILANPKVPRGKKREEILKAAARYRDATSFAMTQKEWVDMAQMMGIENMGGPAVHFLPDFPTPTVTRGASAEEAMKQMGHGNMTNMGARDTSKAAASMNAMDHSKMNMPAGGDSAKAGEKAGMSGMNHRATDSTSAAMMDMHMRLLADPVIRRRMLADTAMRRMAIDMVNQMPAEHREMMMQMLSDTSGKTTSTPTRPSTSPKRASTPRTPAKSPKKAAPKAVAKPAPKAKKDSMPGMDHSKMPGMKKP